MNYNALKLITTVLFALFANEDICKAGQPQPVSGTLAVGQLYTVPADKILLVDCLSQQAATATVGAGTMRFDVNSPTLTFPRPLKLGAGQQLVPALVPLSYWGALIDTADLYVGIPNQIDSVGVSNDVVVAKVNFKTTQPALVRVEKSQDLETWLTDTNAIIPFKGNQTNLAFTTPVGAQTKAFYRTKLFPR